MKNRFKFRVWDKINEVYFGGDYGVSYFLSDSEIDDDLYRFQSDGPFELSKDDDFIVEQCTGLKDKNGVLIYEGDILGYKDYEDKRVVVWNDKYMAYRVHDEDGVDCGSVYQEYIGEFGIEVIGNIHENPELLKEEQ